MNWNAEILLQSGPMDIPSHRRPTWCTAQHGLRKVRITPRIEVQYKTISGTCVGISQYNDEQTQSYCLVFGYVLEPLWYQNHAGRPSEPSQCIYEIFRNSGPEKALNQNGIYTILIYDAVRDLFFCGVDKYGMSPVFYSLTGSILYLSNDFTDIVQQYANTPDQDAIEEYLELGFPLENKTFYREIRRLEPSSYIVNGANTLCRVNRYWSFDHLSYHAVDTPKPFIKDSIEIYRNTIRECLLLTKSPVCLVSSGLDSRRILLEMLQQNASPYVYNVEILDKRFPTPVSIEDHVIRRLIAHQKVRYCSVLPPKLKELEAMIEKCDTLLGFQADEHEWIFPLLDIIPYGIGTNYDGLGGDVIYGAPLTWPPEAYRKIDISSVVFSKNKYMRYLSVNFRQKLSSPLEERVQHSLKSLPSTPNRLVLYWLLGRTRRVVSLFPSSLLATKIESLFPYLDDRVVFHALEADPFWKQHIEIRREILNTAYPYFSRIPSSRDVTERIPEVYKKDMRELFNDGASKITHYREYLKLERLNHALTHCPKSFAHYDFLNARGRSLYSLAKLSTSLGIIEQFPRLVLSHFWAIPRLLKMVRVMAKVNDCL